MAPNNEQARVGIDIGGTFTDAFIAVDGRLQIAKVLTRTEDRAAGFLEALHTVSDRAGTTASSIEFLSHGTTTATNALVENTLARVGFVTNAGFTDMLEIGTQQRDHTYGLRLPNSLAVVPRDRCFGVSARIDAQGAELAPLDLDEVREVASRLRDSAVEAIAICMLFSFVDSSHEREIARILEEEIPGVPISISSEIAPEIREYVRASTTVLNAALLPLVGGYIDDIATGLQSADVETPLYLMQSNGGLTTGEIAAERPLSLAESGPAAGVMGLARIGMICGERDLLTFDMGGTTIDVSLVTDGIPAFRYEGEAAGQPINLPQVDLLSIGAGGGSIASVDSQGQLSVGPESAGSRPGPAAYGLGGVQATVTDAHVVLGNLSPDRKLGGSVQLDRERAREAIRKNVADPLGISVEEAASGILRVVNANMSRAARLVSVARGLDPRQFTLAAFGGAGSLHACAVADELHMTKVLIPRYPGVASAIGLLVSAVRHDVRQGWPRRLDEVSLDELTGVLDSLEATANGLLLRAGHADTEVTFEADMRYEGQGYSLTVPLQRDDISSETLERLAEALAGAHRAAYGYVPAHPEMEIVSLRATGRADAHPIASLGGSMSSGDDHKSDLARVFLGGSWRDVPVMHREAVNGQISGPAIFQQEDTTILLEDGWKATPIEDGNLLLERTRKAVDA